MAVVLGVIVFILLACFTLYGYRETERLAAERERRRVRRSDADAG